MEEAVQSHSYCRHQPTSVCSLRWSSLMLIYLNVVVNVGLSSSAGFHRLKRSPAVTTVQCTDQQFKCPEGYCIPMDWICDEYVDCQHGEDELNCYSGTSSHVMGSSTPTGLQEGVNSVSTPSTQLPKSSSTVPSVTTTTTITHPPSSTTKSSSPVPSTTTTTTTTDPPTSTTKSSSTVPSTTTTDPQTSTTKSSSTIPSSTTNTSTTDPPTSTSKSSSTSSSTSSVSTISSTPSITSTSTIDPPPPSSTTKFPSTPSSATPVMSSTTTADPVPTKTLSTPSSTSLSTASYTTTTIPSSPLPTASSTTSSTTTTTDLQRSTITTSSTPSSTTTPVITTSDPLFVTSLPYDDPDLEFQPSPEPCIIRLPFNCTNRQYNGRILGIIPGDWVCDGENDCGDEFAQDELNCSAVECNRLPRDRKRYCSDGACISAALVCNGWRDCADGSDEAACSCSDGNNKNDRKVQCLAPWPSQCISIGSWCDGKRDCNDSSDETFCNTSVLCPKGSMRCNVTNRCIAASSICNRYVDCPDYSDEINCSCSESYGYQCKMGFCVRAGSWCDGVADCPDNSDEPPDCQNSCAPNFVRCPNGNCIRQMDVCDGFNTCDDFSDEMNCQCNFYEFRCQQLGLCVDIGRWCDGQQDCPDSSDEPANCNHNCPVNWLRCDSRCLSPVFVCDGTFHCIDHSDELHCNDNGTRPPLWFDTTSDVLTVNYRGMPGYLVCAEGWTQRLSDLVCIHSGCNSSLRTSYIQPKQQSKVSYLVTGSTNTLSLLPGSCNSHQVVNLRCQCNNALCGNQPGRSVTNSAAMSDVWPWHVVLFNKLGYLCSGTIISRSWIITSAHCLVVGNPNLATFARTLNVSDLTIYVGLNELWSNEGQPVHADRIVIHPLYNITDRSFDITLIHLTIPLTLTDDVQPVCLPQPIPPTNYSRCVIVGFAYTSFSGFSPFHRLVNRDADLKSYSECINQTSHFAPIEFHNSSMICANVKPNDDSGVCFGDNGNTLIYREMSQSAWTLLGTASWTMTGCGSIVYTHLASSLNWLQQTILGS